MKNRVAYKKMCITIEPSNISQEFLIWVIVGDFYAKYKRILIFSLSYRKSSLGSLKSRPQFLKIYANRGSVLINVFLMKNKCIAQINTRKSGISKIWKLRLKTSKYTMAGYLIRSVFKGCETLSKNLRRLKISVKNIRGLWKFSFISWI